MVEGRATYEAAVGGVGFYAEIYAYFAGCGWRSVGGFGGWAGATGADGRRGGGLTGAPSRPAAHAATAAPT